MSGRNIREDWVATPVDGIEGRYRVEFDPGWRVLYIFGGMTLATAVETARVHLDRDDLALITAQATYSAPIDAGPAAVQIDVIRQGRRGAQALCRVWNTDDPTAEPRSDLLVSVVLGANPVDVAPLVGRTFPTGAGSPRTGISRQAARRPGVFDIPFHDQHDLQMQVGEDWVDPDRPPREPVSSTWFRLTHPPLVDGAWAPAALCVPGDMLGMAVAAGYGGSAQYFVVTMQLSLQWFEPVRTEWVLQHPRVVSTHNGFVTGDLELWSEDRTLVGFASQTALLRPVERVDDDRRSGADQG
jgi:acyl-CoA thioesterase